MAAIIEPSHPAKSDNDGVVNERAASLSISPEARRLSRAEIEQFKTDGYVKNLPVFDANSVATLQDQFHEMSALVPPGIDMSKINNWFKCHTFCWTIIRTPAILDYVEDLLGPNFFLWGNQFFVKFPKDESIVPFHQDAQYWPLNPARTVTVWLALFDADEDNGAMEIVRGSHTQGRFEHHVNEDPRYALEQEVSDSQIDRDKIVPLTLNAGEISLHDDGLLHGSPANNSDRIRAGMTMRFCPTEVKCDLSVWPTFETTMMRGIDEYRHNPVCKAPTRDHYPVKKFQHSSEFL